MSIIAVCEDVPCNFADQCYHLQYWDLSRALSLVAVPNNERAQWLTNNEYGCGGPESNKANGLAICRIADLKTITLPRESELALRAFNLM